MQGELVLCVGGVCYPVGMIYDWIAITGSGLEAVVKRELEPISHTRPRRLSPGRVLFTGPLETLCAASLRLRSADRIALRVGEFPATDFGELFDGVRDLPWGRWIVPDGRFPVRGRSVRSKLSSVPACQRIAKKAIVETLRAAHRRRTLPETGPQYAVEVALLNDAATLTIDTTGPGLNKRGYRPIAGKAALKETIAAAMVQLSFWRPDRPLIDPFCGTGTISIEAALLGRNIAPGLHRRFAAEDWSAIPRTLWDRAREQARDEQRPKLDAPILGCDIHEGALSLARRNACAAGVADDVRFETRDFADLDSGLAFGCLIGNPPYGQRLAADPNVRALYRRMPEVLRRLRTWSHYILTAWSGFERLMGRDADRTRTLYNGGIEVTFYEFHGPRPGSDVQPPAAELAEATGEDADQLAAPAPAFGGVSPHALSQVEDFRNRLAKRARHLRRYPKKGVTCYRLYDRDIPEVPLAVDTYEGRLHIAEYERPHDRTPAEHADWLDLMAAAAAEVMDTPPEEVFLKRRQRQRGASQYERVGEQGRTFVVHEGGLAFRVNLSDYLDTGLFLDHRLTREMVREQSDGKEVLNLFCYTGAFTVYAAAGGAASTTSVDLSNTYLDWAAENLSLNGLTDPKHRLIRADVMQYLRELPPGEAWDLAIVDPPTFSNSKMTEDVFDIQRDHVELLNRVLERLRPGGRVYFSTNFRKFKLDEPPLLGEAREISAQTVPPEYRNRKVHRCWTIAAAT